MIILENRMSNTDKPKPPSLLKWIGIPVLVAVIFMGILYLAIENEPDYMPAQQKKAQGIDVHAKHANTTPATEDEHAQHSAEEHAEAVAEESTTAHDEESSHAH